MNLFYLRDVLLKTGEASSQSQLTLEKVRALGSLKVNSHLQVFKFSMEPLLMKGSFCQQITEVVVQIELMKTIGSSDHHELLKPLQKLLAVSLASLHPEVVTELRASIHRLQFKKQSL